MLKSKCMGKIKNDNIRHVVHPYEPVKGINSRVLVLGSIPSVRSMTEGFYYMHPQNRFWPVMAGVFGDEGFLSRNINEKKSALIRNHVALYDAICECDIWLSSDSSVTGIVPTNIDSIVSGTNITHIFCNGRRAYDVMQKYSPQYMNMTSYLPSTSPANAAFKLDRLIEAWRCIRIMD